MPAPLLIPAAGLIAKGLTALGAALGLGAKAVVLSAAALKVAAIGTGFIVKGVVFTKTGFAVLTVAAGGVAYMHTTNATVETMGHLDYHIEQEAQLPVIKQDIENKVRSKGEYVARYCLSEDGKKIVVPQKYKFCPRDGSEPIEGHKFKFTDEVAKK